MSNIINFDVYYEKYLKYKTKYLKLKELLGGVDPTQFNNNSIVSREKLFDIISNLLADIIIYAICDIHQLLLNDEEINILENYINLGFWRDNIQVKSNFRDTIKQLLLDMIQREEIEINTIGYENVKLWQFKIKKEHFREDSIVDFLDDKSNIHISFVMLQEELKDSKGRPIYHEGKKLYKDFEINYKLDIHLLQ
jgi:hypothetical protein